MTSKTQYSRFLATLLVLAISLLGVVSASWTSELNDGLIAYYTMNETTGDKMNSVDSSIYNFTISGGTLTGTGLIGDAFQGDSTNNANAGAILTSFGNTNEMAMSLWFSSNFTFATFPHTLIEFPDSYFLLYIALANCEQSSDGIAIYFNSLGCQSIAGVYTNGGWHNLVFTTSDGNILVYLDSTLKLNNSLGAVGTYTDNVVIGSKEVSSNYKMAYGEYLDEMAFWNRSLTSDEVLDLFNSASGITYIPTGESPPINVTYPYFELEAPLELANLTAGNILFHYDVLANNVSNSTLYLYNETGFFNSYFSTFIGNETEQEVENTISLTDGTYTWFATAYNTQGNFNVSENRTLYIYTEPVIPPVIPPQTSGNAIRDLFIGTGAGLGIFLQILAIALPVLLIGIAMVIVIWAFASMLRKVFEKVSLKGGK